MQLKCKQLLPIAITLIVIFGTLGFVVEQVPMDICPECHSSEHTKKDWVLPHETVDAFYSSHNYNYYYEIPHPEKIPGGFKRGSASIAGKGGYILGSLSMYLTKAVHHRLSTSLFLRLLVTQSIRFWKKS